MKKSQNNKILSAVKGPRRVNVLMRRGGEALLDHMKRVLEQSKLMDNTYTKDLDERSTVSFFYSLSSLFLLILDLTMQFSFGLNILSLVNFITVCCIISLSYSEHSHTYFIKRKYDYQTKEFFKIHKLGEISKILFNQNTSLIYVHMLRFPLQFSLCIYIFSSTYFVLALVINKYIIQQFVYFFKTLP